jgi:flagellar motor switch protein FliN/FliY
MSESEASPSATEQPVERAEFDELGGSTGPDAGQDINLDLVLNVDLDLALEVGRTTISVKNLLQLNQGSVVELDRLAGEPLDVLVNGTLIARGEVVVVNDKYGIRLTDVVSPAERIKRFQ